MFIRQFLSLDKKKSAPYTKLIFWGLSSVGRAIAWHAIGQGFDSPRLHHFFLKFPPSACGLTQEFGLELRKIFEKRGFRKLFTFIKGIKPHLRLGG